MAFSALNIKENITGWFTLIIQRTTIASIVWRSVMAAAASLMFLSSTSSSSSSKPSFDDGTNQRSDEWTPSFYYLNTRPFSDVHGHNEEDTELLVDYYPSFHELNTALRHYREMADGIVRQISISHEVASRTEQLLFPNHDPMASCKGENSLSFLSCKLEKKITKSASLLEQNVMVLENLLKPFPVNAGLLPIHNAPSSHSPSKSQFTFPPSHHSLYQHVPGSGNSIQSLARYIPPYNPNKDRTNEGEEEPYDTASHIITHIARDWTADGVDIRKDTHDWIVDQLWSHHNMQIQAQTLQQDTTSSQDSPLSPVLVPGAGMARLAFDIAFACHEIDGTMMYPFAAEAVDNSIVMAGAAYNLIHRFSKHEQDVASLRIYPFVSDPFINEVDTHRRWDSTTFPEDAVLDQLHRLNTQQSSHEPSLSYVVADFVSVYASPLRHAAYGSIATCYFIDTATNIYEYILAIRNLLRPGAVWINFGPVQWHQNAQLQPTTEELKDIIILAGFKIMHWEISTSILAYRHPNDIQVGTRIEAYRPLKFVAVLLEDHVSREAETGGDLLSSMEKLRQVTGRRSMKPS